MELLSTGPLTKIKFSREIELFSNIWSSEENISYLHCSIIYYEYLPVFLATFNIFASNNFSSPEPLTK